MYFLPTSLSELLKTFESVLEFEKQIAPNNLKTRKLEHKQPLPFYTHRGFNLLLQALATGFPSGSTLWPSATVSASTRSRFILSVRPFVKKKNGLFTNDFLRLQWTNRGAGCRVRGRRCVGVGLPGLISGQND